MTLLLAIDTSSRVAGVALVTEERVLAEATWHAANNHTVQLLPVIQHLLATSRRSTRDLQALAVAVGPGAFSGLRVGIATAKSLAWALGVPCLGIGSLDAMAAAVPQAPRLLAVLDAGRGEWYWACYVSVRGARRRLTPPQLGAPEAVLSSLTHSTLLIGEVSAEQRALVDERFSRFVAYGDLRLPPARPAALGLLALDRLAAGERDDPAGLQPVYLRRSAAEERQEERR